MSDDTSTKSVPDKPAAPKKPTAAPVKKPEVGGFGDAPLGGNLVEPVSFDKRDRKGLQHAQEIFGLVLSPAQLALAITVLPLAAGTKPSLLALLGGLVAGATATVAVQAPLLRYGVPLGVLARTTFGWRGARLFSAARLLVLIAFFGSGVFLAAQTFMWCALCAAPSTVAWVQRVPLFAGTSLVVFGLTLIGAVGVWLVSARPSTRVRMALALPALVLVVLLWFLPDNLPLGTAWGMLDVVGRADSTNVFPIFLLTFAWSAGVYLSPASETRLQPTQLSQTLAVFGAGVLPWLLGTMALALAVLSSGQSETGLFDLPALACRRLAPGLLIPVLALASLAYVWPLAHVTKRAALVSVQEMFGGRASALVLRVAEYAFFAMGLGVALAARTRATWLLGITVAGQVVIVTACLVIAVQYFVVDRTKLVLDDLYTIRGPYKGIAGVLPAGWASLAVASATLLWGLRQGYALAMSVGFALVVALIAQALFGNVQKLFTQRSR